MILFLGFHCASVRDSSSLLGLTKHRPSNWVQFVNLVACFLVIAAVVETPNELEKQHFWAFVPNSKTVFFAVLVGYDPQFGVMVPRFLHFEGWKKSREPYWPLGFPTHSHYSLTFCPYISVIAQPIQYGWSVAFKLCALIQIKNCWSSNVERWLML